MHIYTSPPEIKHLYPNAEYVSEDDSKYGPTLQVSIYYWTKDDPGEVQKHYEAYVPAFAASSDEYGAWLISGYEPETKLIHNGPNQQHQSICPHEDDRQCVSIVLLDLPQNDPYRTVAASAGLFRNLTAPPYFQSVPPNGTMIIYNFWQVNLN